MIGKDIFIKPASAGAIIRDPITYAPLDAEGEAKPNNSFWRRKLARGEVLSAVPLAITGTRKNKGDKA